MKVPAPENICLLRFSSLGDISHVLPLVHALRQRYPQAQLDWIIDQRYQSLIPDLPGLSLKPFDKQAGLTGLRQLRRQIKAQRYAAMLLLQTSIRANLISTLVRARHRLGWDRQRGREGQWLFCNAHIKESAPQHQVQAMLAFARTLDADVTEPCWPITIAPEDQAFAARCLPDNQPTLAISPCSSHPLRNWSAQRYAAVADVAAELGLRVAILGAPTEVEQQMAAAIETHARTPVINLVGKDTPVQMLALLQRSQIVLSPDSGPLHWASALHKPVIGLYAATWSKRSGPYNSLDLCVDRFNAAAERYRHRSAEQLRWGTRIEVPGVMDLISVQDVCTQLEKAVSHSTRNEAQ